MTRIVIDPVTRLEGHLRIELELEGGTVVRAFSSGTSFRGFEPILRGRDPRDAPHITQRICGVCPIPHARAACEAFEQAAGIAVNDQARLIRNLVLAANFVDSHVLHFYTLALPDYVSGLPAAASRRPGARPRAWRGGERLDAAALAGHAAASLAVRRACHELIVALAGKMPHAAGIVAGGATARPTRSTLDDLAGLLARIRAFVDGPYADDAAALDAAFPVYRDLGASGAALLSFGGFPERDGRLLLAGGLAGAEGGGPRTLDPEAIAESTARARYTPAGPVHPALGTTEPQFDRAEAYTWIKAARLGGRPCEVGPLARAVLAGRDPGGRGVMARHRARQAEAALLAAAMQSWLAELAPDAGALPRYPEVPAAGAGAGRIEAPRGALGHWLAIEGGRIERYGVISPTTWNASPRDEQGVPGPIESALEGVALADPGDPIEAVRIVHSFDPCLQCAVH